MQHAHNKNVPITARRPPGDAFGPYRQTSSSRSLWRVDLYVSGSSSGRSGPSGQRSVAIRHS
jgi:hypothetical protein